MIIQQSYHAPTKAVSSAALMHIHNLEEVDLEVVVDLFAQKHPRSWSLEHYSEIEFFACGLWCIYSRFVVSSHFH